MNRSIRIFSLTLALLALVTAAPALSQTITPGPGGGGGGTGGGGLTCSFVLPTPPPYTASSGTDLLIAQFNQPTCASHFASWSVQKVYGPSWISGSAAFGQSLYLWWSVPSGTPAGSYLVQFTLTGCPATGACQSYTVSFRVLVP